MIYRYRVAKFPEGEADPDELLLKTKIAELFPYVVDYALTRGFNQFYRYMEHSDWFQDRFGPPAYTADVVETNLLETATKTVRFIELKLIEGRWVSMNPWNPLPHSPRVSFHFKDARDAMLFKLNRTLHRS